MWSPAAVGRAFDLSPTALSPLEPFREDVTIISNTDVRNAEAFTTPEIGGDHFRSSAVFLTQAHPKQTQGSDLRAGISIDQLYAQRYGQETAIPSMQLCIEKRRSGGRLRVRLLLRVHRLDQLVLAVRAAADDPRPARDFRSAVWRRCDAGRARRAAARGPQHHRHDHRGRRPPEERARPGGPDASERLPGGRARNRAAHPARRSAQRERRDARAPGRARGRAGFVRRARQADVRSAGARLRLEHHAHVRVQALARRVGPRVPGDRRHDRLPQRVAPQRARRPDQGFREDQSLSRQPGAVFPRALEENAGRRTATCSTTR